MTDKSIFEKQAELQNGFVKKGMANPCDMQHATRGQVLDYIQEIAFFLNEEISELMYEIGGSRDAIKPWSDNYKQSRKHHHVTTDHIKSEAMDMMCFAINICFAAGVKPEDFEAEYHKVFKKNKDRQNAKPKAKAPAKKVQGHAEF